MKNIFYLSALVVVLLNFSSCKKDESDDFSGPTAQALNETFGTGFEDEILRDVSIDKNGTIYVTAKTKIYKLDANGIATVFAGSNTSSVTDGQGTAATFRDIDLLSFDDAGNMYAIDYEKIRKISPSGAVTSLLVTEPYQLLLKNYEDSPVNPPSYLGLVTAGNALYASAQTVIFKIRGSAWNIFAGSETLQQGFVDGQGLNAKFQFSSAIALAPSGSDLIIADGGSLRKVALADRVVTTYVGSVNLGSKDGNVSEATFSLVRDFVIDKGGNTYLSASTVRKISASGNVTTIAGPIKSDGSSFQAGGIAIDASARYLYVTDLSKKAYSEWKL